MQNSISHHDGLGPHSSAASTASRIAFSWLLHLRWGALAGQTVLILAVYLLFHITVPLLILSAIIGFAALSNIFFYYLIRRQSIVPEWVTALIMFLDILLLTLLLWQTGGQMNPFTFLYLVHIVLGAILLRPTLAWGLVFFTILSYASVFYLPNPSVLQPDSTSIITSGELCHDPSTLQDSMSLHLQGMLIAFAITSFFIVFFIGRIQKALGEHQETIARLKEETTRNEKLAALATLSAGAAHEFSTPLSIIAVASGEMLHTLKQSDSDPELIEDTILIRNQVDRCKEILYHLAADAGEPLGEVFEEVTTDTLLDNAVANFPDELSRIKIHNELHDQRFHLPVRTVKRIIKGLIKNALDASPGGNRVDLYCRKTTGSLVIEIHDQGAGMDKKTVAKSTEPFFTTKEPGKGLGLGLFLAKTVAERFGGEITIQSDRDTGTIVAFKLALDRCISVMP